MWNRLFPILGKMYVKMCQHVCAYNMYTHVCVYIHTHVWRPLQTHTNTLSKLQLCPPWLASHLLSHNHEPPPNTPHVFPTCLSSTPLWLLSLSFSPLLFKNSCSYYYSLVNHSLFSFPFCYVTHAIMGLKTATNLFDSISSLTRHACHGVLLTLSSTFHSFLCYSRHID